VAATGWPTDEIASWRGAGISTVLSLLMPDEEKYLDLAGETREVARGGMKFLSLPIPDRQIPQTESQIAGTLEPLDADLFAGKNVVIHCRQGVGRSGLLAACLLVTKGIGSGAAVDVLSAARGVPIPETPEQRRWVDHFAASFASAK
jgi:protein-tyrosine phosphatase